MTGLRTAGLRGGLPGPPGLVGALRGGYCARGPQKPVPQRLRNSIVVAYSGRDAVRGAGGVSDGVSGRLCSGHGHGGPGRQVSFLRVRGDGQDGGRRCGAAGRGRGCGGRRTCGTRGRDVLLLLTEH